MSNFKSNFAKVLFMGALLCPVAFAEGDQGSGGFANNAEPVVETTKTGDQGSGGRSAPTQSEGYIDSVLLSIQRYLKTIF